MGQNNSEIEYISCRFRGSGGYGSLLVQFPKEVIIKPVADNLAGLLRETSETADVNGFSPNTRNSCRGYMPTGDYASYSIQDGNRVIARVKCSDEKSDWASFELEGIDGSIKILEQFKNKYLTESNKA